VRPAEVRVVEVRLDEVHAAEVRPSEVRLAEVYNGKPSFGSQRVPDFDALPTDFEMLGVRH
jgi:hypothetical protein